MKSACIFIHTCLILHNIILGLEGTQYDAKFREELLEEGRRVPHSRDPPGDAMELLGARQRVEMPGQRFHKDIMARLFNSGSNRAL